MNAETAFGWISERSTRWMKTAYGREGRPGLSLRVLADPDDKDEPWTWEVLEVDAYGDEMEIDLGGAKSQKAAIKAADAAAAVYVEGD